MFWAARSIESPSKIVYLGPQEVLFCIAKPKKLKNYHANHCLQMLIPRISIVKIFHISAQFFHAKHILLRKYKNLHIAMIIYIFVTYCKVRINNNRLSPTLAEFSYILIIQVVCEFLHDNRDNNDNIDAG